MIRQAPRLLACIREIHERMRDRLVQVCEQESTEQLTKVVDDQHGDVVFGIDRISEMSLVKEFNILAADWSFVLIAEGLGTTGTAIMPAGVEAHEAELRIIVDPIDGTRELMYGKRSAWILTGVAPNRGENTTLADIELAIQTEIPLVKQHLSDTLWALAGQGVSGERYNRLNGQRQPFVPRPSSAATIWQGFGNLFHPFPGPRAELTSIDESVIELVLGKPPADRPLTFEDQYISTGGQLYEIMMGHTRWIADIRPLVAPLLQPRGVEVSICCHPYDLATELIAREAGVIVTDEHGRSLEAPLDIATKVAWIAYANETLAQSVGKALREVLIDRKLI